MKKNKKLTRRKFLICFFAFFGALNVLNPIKAANAITVFDPSNFSQNILQAIRALQSNVNEARMIANQVTMLANDIKNLTKLPHSIVDDFSVQFSELFSEVGAIHGLVEDLATLHSEFDTLYPEFNLEFGPIKNSTISEKTKAWLEESRNSMLKASVAGAKILEDLPRTQAHVEGLLRDSSNAVGILQAAQAGNEIAATITGNLTSLNTQLATYSSAHTSFLMQVNSSSALAKNRMKNVLKGYKPASNKRVPLQSY